MLKGTRRVGAIAMTAAMLVTACSSAGSTPTPAPTDAPAPVGATVCVKGSIITSGSTALQPLVQDAATAYMGHCAGSTVTVNGGGSGTGLSQVAQGSVQIGASDVTADTKLTAADAAKLVDHVVCRQGWIVVTNKGVTGVANLSTQQQVDIWTGKVTNWKDVGGPDLPIILIFRPLSSGTRATFKKIVLAGLNETNGGQTLTEDSNGAVTAAITKTNGSMSVIGFSYYNDPANKPLLNGLQLDGVDATIANVGNGTYKLSADGNLYSFGPATGLTAAFLNFMMGSEVQGTIIPKDSYGAVVH